MSTSSPPRALDVRPLRPARKAVTVLATFDRLDAGESFVLVDDRDPSPIRSRVEAERPGKGEWIYLRRGPHVWHVEVARRADAGAVT